MGASLPWMLCVMAAYCKSRFRCRPAALGLAGLLATAPIGSQALAQQAQQTQQTTLPPIQEIDTEGNDINSNLATSNLNGTDSLEGTARPLEEIPNIPQPSTTTDTYEPLGLRAGSFLFFPSVELREGYTDNVAGAVGPKTSGSFTEIEGALSAQSNWSRHSFVGAMRGAYTHFGSSSGDDESNFAADATAVIDIRRNTKATISGAAYIEDENDATDYEYDLSGALAHRFNRVTASLLGALEIFKFSTRTVSTGSVARDDVADYRSQEIGLRLAYEFSPEVSVFTEAKTNRHLFDDSVDADGFLRGSDGYVVSVGTDLDLNTLLRGSVAVGYQVQKPDDSRFTNVEGIVFDADITWAITPLTTLTANFATDFEETVNTGSSGSINRTAGIGVTHQLRRNVLLTGALDFSRNTFEGAGPTEDTLTAAFGVEYLLNRNLALTADYTYYSFESETAGSDYTVNSIMFGLRLQR